MEDFAHRNLHWSTKGLKDDASDKNKQASHTEQTPHENEKLTAVNNTLIATIPRLVDRVHLQDLENMLHYSFWREIPLQKNINGEKLMALRSFLSLLAKVIS